MVEYYFVGTLQKLLFVTSSILILIYNPTLVNLALAMTISTSIAVILYFILYLRYIKIFKLSRVDSELIRILWDNTWKTGATKLIAPILYYFSGIFYAQIASPGNSGSYLLIQRIFNMIQEVSTQTFNTYLPQISRLRSRNEFTAVRKIIYKASLISYSIVVMGYISLISIAKPLLTIIGSNILFPPKHIIILFSFNYILGRITGFQSNLATQAGEIIDHKAISIMFVSYFIFLLAFKNNLGMWIFPSAGIFATLSAGIYIFPRSYKLYNSSMWLSERLNYIPVLLFMIAINAFYYL